jgi:enoyl-CoA hydratase/carnithine racemase
MSEKLIKIKQHDEIGVVKLSRGIINAIDNNLMLQLSEALESTRLNPDIRGLVLSSSNAKFFSIGFDIPYLYNLPEAEFASFFHSFNLLCLSLYTFPKPTIAALTGHTTAGGCILALCCDQRIIAEGRRLIGLNEIKLGVPVPFIAECILRQIINGRVVREIVESGGFYSPDEAISIGLVDDACPPERIIATAVEKVKQLASNSPSAFAAIKHSRTMEVEEKIHSRLEERERVFVENWFSQEARQLLKEAISKF